MQNENLFQFYLNNICCSISDDCLYISDLKPSIYNKLLNEKMYRVKSKVSDYVFYSFINYLKNREAPIINYYNFFEYSEISEEFDTMKDLIQMYEIKTKCSINFPLINKNQKLKQKIFSKNIQIHKAKQNYEQIIKHLFQNTDYETNFLFSSSKSSILKALIDENFKELEILTSKEVNLNGLSFILNKENKTAALYLIKKPIAKLIVPQSIKFKKKKFFVTQIFEKAFQNVKGVKSIEFANDSKVTSIQKSGLSSPSLRKFTIPMGLTDFSTEIFQGTQNLNEIEFNSNDNRFLYYENKFLIGKNDEKSEIYDVLLFARRDLEEASIPSFIKKISPYSFEKCQRLKRIEFLKGSKLKTIDDFAFFNSGLEYILIPSSVKRIGESAFDQCYGLKKVEFESDSKLKKIGNKAFQNSNLESIIIPSYVVRINDNAFYECRNLSKVEFARNCELKSIGCFAFSRTFIECISIPSTVVQIESNAFSYSSNLTKIDFPDESELLIIGKCAFILSKFESFTIPSKVIDLQKDWCLGMKHLTHVKVMPSNNNFLYYEDKFLLGKSDLKSDIFDILLFARRDIEKVAVLPFIKKIEAAAFDNCRKLKEVDFSENSNLNSIEKYTFNYCASLETVTIPSKIERIEKNSFEMCVSLQKVEFESNSKLAKIGSRAFSSTPLIEIVIPSNVTILSESVFFNCIRLKKVTFPEKSKLKIIDKNAFYSSSIESIVIPSGVTEIRESSFQSCSKLSKFSFLNNSKLKLIQERAFFASSIRCISIPSNVLKIGNFAFFECNKLEIIEIDDNSKLISFVLDSIFGIMSHCQLVLVAPFAKAKMLNLTNTNIF